MELKLFYVGDISGMSAQQLEEAEAFVIASPHIVIATNNKETGARLSTLSNLLPGQAIRELVFATDTSSQKVENIRRNPQCEGLFTDGNGQVILSGPAETYVDLATKQAAWQPWMIEHFPGGAESDTLCIIKFRPVSIRVMLVG